MNLACESKKRSTILSGSYFTKTEHLIIVVTSGQYLNPRDMAFYLTVPLYGQLEKVTKFDQDSELSYNDCLHIHIIYSFKLRKLFKITKSSGGPLEVVECY